MVKMIAVDDSRTDLERIKRIVEETYGSSKPYKLKLFTNAREVYESEEKWDIAILDIMMPGITGMELLYKLRRNNPKTKFIYVTGYDAVVEKAIHSHPFDLVKKRTLEELKQALTDCWVELEKEKQTLVLQGEKEMMEIEFRQLIYFEKEHNYVIFHMENQVQKKLKVSSKKVIEQMKNNEITNLCKINRGLYINMDKYERLEREAVYMENGEGLPIAQRKKKEIIEKLRRYRIEKMGYTKR